MSLKPLIIGTPLERPARSVLHAANWPKRTAKHLRIARKASQRRTPANIDVVVCSPGGVATTMLLKHLCKFVNTNCPNDSDTLKHVPRPEVILSDPGFHGRILYIHGEPASILASIARRGWVGIQGAKLGSQSAAILPAGVGHRAFLRAVEAQITSFLSQQGPRLMALTFDELWNNTEEIANFLGIDDPRFIADFPERKRRQTERLAESSASPERIEHTR